MYAVAVVIVAERLRMACRDPLSSAVHCKMNFYSPKQVVRVRQRVYE